VDQGEIRFGAAVADFAVFVEVEDADVGQLGRLQLFVQISGYPFQVRPALPEFGDPDRVKVDPDKAAGRQHTLAFEQVERQEAGSPHQLAPVAAQPNAVAVLPELMSDNYNARLTTTRIPDPLG
jgi:hypothetical protein